MTMATGMTTTISMNRRTEETSNIEKKTTLTAREKKVFDQPSEMNDANSPEQINWWV